MQKVLRVSGAQIHFLVVQPLVLGNSSLTEMLTISKCVSRKFGWGG